MSAYNNFQTSAGFPTGGAYTNMGYSRAPANVAAVGPAFLQYSEPHSHVERDAYDASSQHLTAPGLASQPPLNTVERLNGEIREMKKKRTSKPCTRRRVEKAKRVRKKVDVACGRCRGSKTQCGGQEPSCEQCVLANVQCVYGQRRRVRVKKAPAESQYSERQLLPRPEQSESLPSPPGLRIPPCPASLPAASGFGESAVGSGGGPSHPGLGRGHGLPTSELEAGPPQAGFDMGHGLLEASREAGYVTTQNSPVLGGWDAQPFGPRQYRQQPGRYDQQCGGYHPTLPVLQEATRVGSAQCRTPRLGSWLVDDCALLVGSRALRITSYALPASGTVVLEVDGSVVQHDVHFPFTWADFAAWPPETFLSVAPSISW